MKKLIYSMLALATIAFGFCSCEDVPMPYGYPQGSTDPTNPDLPAEGEGTLESPYNVAAANAVIAGGDFDPEKQFYIKGIVTSIDETDGFPNSFGNVTYNISDKADASNKLLVYRGMGFGGAKVNSTDDLKVGDEVVVMGKLINYSGKYEVTQGSKIVVRNGQSSVTTGTPEGEGTQQSPYNVAAALKLVNALPADVPTENAIYVKGKISKINNVETATFGNANYYISDDGTESGQILIFQSLYLGNVKFTSADQIKVGDEVIIYGKFVNFKGNTPETVGKGTSYIYSLNGKTQGGGETGGTTTGEAKGDGTKNNPYNALGAKAFAGKLESGQTSTEEVYIKGKISSIKYNFSAEFGTATFNISDDGKAANEFIIYSTLYLNNEKYTAGDLLSVGDDVVILGKVTNYNGTLETASRASYIYSWTKNGGSTGGEGGGGEATGSDVTIKAGDISSTNAADVTEVTVKDIAFSFSKGSGANTPKYYTAGGGTIRMYPGNSVTINAGSKKIAKIVVECDAYNGVNYTAEGKATCSPGKATLNNLTYTFSEINAAKVTITDAAEGTGQPKQLRIKSMQITFAK